MHAMPTIDDFDLTDADADVEATEIDWSTARCRDGYGTLTHLFFGDDLMTIARAKAICSRCHLRAACIEGALDRQEPWGVWGGELIENGKIVVTKRPRGRPPKHPRPELIVDEVPIPPHMVA